MKKLLLLIIAAVALGTAAYSQTQRTNRTNSRPHDRSEVTTKEAPVTDQDKNNPDPNKSRAVQLKKDSVGKRKRK